MSAKGRSRARTRRGACARSKSTSLVESSARCCSSRCSCCSASGVWIGIDARDRRRAIGMDLVHDASGGRHAKNLFTRSGARTLVDARGAAALHLDGRDPVPHATVRADVQRPRAVARARARTAACTRRSSAARSSASVSGSSAATCATIAKVALPELCAAATTRSIALGVARRRRHARHPDPAVDHMVVYARGRRSVDRAHLPRGLPARASC